MVELLSYKFPLILDATNVPHNLKVLVLAPHPDDFDVIGITMRLFHNNNSIFLAVLSSGASGVEDSFCECDDLSVKASIREEEQLNSCKYFGLRTEDVEFMRLEEDDFGHLLSNCNNIDKIKLVLLDNTPDIICLPHGNDKNIDHQITHRMLHEILKECDSPIITLLNRSPDTISMQHDLYIVFDDNDAEWKSNLLLFHHSQHMRNLHLRKYGFDERILNINKYIARKYLNIDKYAEVFEIEIYRKK